MKGNPMSSIDSDFVFTYPVCSLLLKDASGLMMYQRGPDLYFTLFNGDEFLESFLKAQNQFDECCVKKLNTPEELLYFMEHLPSRIGPHHVEKVLIDPLDDRRRYIEPVFTNDVIALLKSRL